MEPANWKEFKFKDIFIIKKGFYNKKPEHTKNGDIPFLGATDKNNGVTEYYSYQDIENASKTGDDNNVSIGNKIFPKNSLCVTNNGSVGYAYFQPVEFTCSHDVNPLYLKEGEFNRRTALFVATVIMHDRYRWSYGRKWRPERMKKSVLSLPATEDGKPDWKYMEEYIEAIENRKKDGKESIRDSIKTDNKEGKYIDVNPDKWGKYKLSEIFDVKYGINIDLNKCELAKADDKDSINYVSRTSENNGVTARVKVINDKEPQPAGIITCAGGGSVLSTFLQNEPFYSGRDLYLLIPKYEMSTEVKMFLITIIEADKYRYNYGRQANITLPYLELRLPSRNNQPDWKYMHDYIKNLPYGDKLY